MSYERLASSVQNPLAVLWGKSAGKGGGRSNLLLQHLLDTAAVAELMWDHYLAPSVRQMLDGVAGDGGGRRLFAWLCGIHDFGKATPAFQHMDAAGAARVLAAGLTWDQRTVERYRNRWRHDRAGGALMRRYLKEVGWSEESIGWVWPLIAGHHGLFPTLGKAREPERARGHLSGKAVAWDEARRALLDAFTRAVGFHDVATAEPLGSPSRAAQLQLSGFVVMADWIASDQRHFAGVDEFGQVSLRGARARAGTAWGRLGLRGGWGALGEPEGSVFEQRFGDDPRPSQAMVVDVVSRMEAPGLVVVEAPMGEGKTKAALVAAEALAARWGMDGVFVGMPTQATCDPMFTNVRSWVEAISPSLASQVALLHGKRLFNKQWQDLLEDPAPDDRFIGVAEDEFDLADPYGIASGSCCPEAAAERRAPAEWFLGAKRGLLTPFVVGTIDQLLFAATRTKHVMLRMAGLAGKVVILDEVHAADVYMSQFLAEGLRWLGQARVPVVLLSATLPPAQRRELVAAYLAGAGDHQEQAASEAATVREPVGYPNVTVVWRTTTLIGHLVESGRSWREDLQVGVEILPEPVSATSSTADDLCAGDAEVLSLLRDRLAEGGCALVIRNTVRRAQDTFTALHAEFGDEVRLLHGRLSASDRADRTEECLRALGPPQPRGSGRPARRIVVATQLAEQSFDVDADLLVTDLAPMDLLLQRIGRTHRHSGVHRPGPVSEPRVVVTGFFPRDGAPPELPGAAEAIYGRYLLLRTAAQVCAAEGERWSIPGQVPRLVADVYGPDQYSVPSNWAEAERRARADWEIRQRARAESAEPFLLTRAGEHTRRTLEGLHSGGVSQNLSEEHHQAVVRDGDRSIEVVLVRRDDRGFRALSGRSLGTQGEASRDVLEDVLGGTVRLPAKLTEAAEAELGPLAGWRDHPWLRYSFALPLDASGVACLGEYTLCYDSLLGLVVKEPRR
ncbi:CRISPR-associated helicase Cas3' [Actinomadura livida]|uniref:CRISPR-associated endonuclease/helicase Cas3 n=1 Tax=Actinomadura livida TaxID=79909 RepID=A0A7W7N119_9ACTN|nr:MULTISPECIES: CRISPR-associated helicase Cas3' [Actinomadura]MBB4778523.1 CRISPR-associated endonuclease/helicase Cas3 [Actinomadura catellatispora]